MKPYPAPTRNLRELERARAGLSPAEERDKVNAFLGALSAHTSAEVWDQCLNTAYGYIASCQVKLMWSCGGDNFWRAWDDNTYDGPGSLLGCGATAQEAKDDFWQQWKEKHNGL